MRYKIIPTSEQETELIDLIINWNQYFQSGNVPSGHGGIFLLNRNQRIKSVELIRHEVYQNVHWDGLFILTIDKGRSQMDDVISIAKGDNRFNLLMNWMTPKIREQKLDEIGI